MKEIVSVYKSMFGFFVFSCANTGYLFGRLLDSFSWFIVFLIMVNIGIAFYSLSLWGEKVMVQSYFVSRILRYKQKIEIFESLLAQEAIFDPFLKEQVEKDLEVAKKWFLDVTGEKI